ncbi:MAG: hypothetical protein LAO51_10600 [Acidobacteriia bacterium]|nr:hypothetical protein [Terriglobia bacterium]
MRFTGVLLLLLASACSASAPADCNALNSEQRAALKAWVGGVYAGGGGIDGESVESQRKKIVGYGSEILPCLLALYRQGPAAVGMWERNEAAPANAHWALHLIQAIDRDRAVGLYREWRAEPGTDDMTRTEIDVSLGRLGDHDALGDLARFLEAAPIVGADPRRLRNAREDAVVVVAEQNYTRALAGLKRVAAQENPPSNFWSLTVPVYVAQLSEDVPALARYARDPTCAIPALEALKRIGRNDLLRSLAADMDYRFQGAAKALLEQQSGTGKSER